MTYFGDNGVTVMMLIKRTAFVIEAEEIAGIIKEPGNIPLRLLPEIITACAERIGNANRLAG